MTRSPAWQNRIVGSGEEAPDQLLANRKNRLIRKPGLVIPDGPDEFGMVYQERAGDEWVTRG